MARTWRKGYPFPLISALKSNSASFIYEGGPTAKKMLRRRGVDI